MSKMFFFESVYLSFKSSRVFSRSNGDPYSRHTLVISNSSASASAISSALAEGSSSNLPPSLFSNYSKIDTIRREMRATLGREGKGKGKGVEARGKEKEISKGHREER